MKVEGIPSKLSHEHDLSVTLKVDVDMKDTINDIVTNTAVTLVCAAGLILVFKKVLG